MDENHREEDNNSQVKSADLPRDLFYRACPGPLPDGSCRMPEETCNNPCCMARG